MPGITTFVADADGDVVGFYKLIPNRRDRGAHVANASFMVDPASAGRGIGYTLGRHCLEEARRRGYVAMQFNFVVSTNRPCRGVVAAPRLCHYGDAASCVPARDAR